MTGEISTGRTGQIVIPELEDIKAKKQSFDEAYNVSSEALDSRIETLEFELTALRSERGGLESAQRSLTRGYREELNAEATKLLHGVGEIGDRHTDDCYKIYANYFSSDEETMHSTFITLVRARQQAEEADENTLFAVLDEEEPDQHIVTLWKPSMPLVGVNGLTGDIDVGIHNGVVARSSDHESKSRVIEVDDDRIVIIPVASLDQAVEIHKDDPRVEQLVGLDVIEHIVKYSHFDSAIYSVQRVIKARDILGLETPKEEILERINQEFRSKTELGRLITEFEASVIPADFSN